MKNWSVQVFFMELRQLITYRADFWINFFGQTFISLTIAYFLWDSIFLSAQTKVMNGFTIQGMIFYYLCVPLIFRVQQGQGIGFISREIYDGGLNKYLLYPIDIFKYKTATYLANATFFLLQLFFLILVYNIFFYDPNVYSFSLLAGIKFLILLVIASLSFFYLFLCCELMAFWFDNIWSLGVILRFITSFFGGALIPLAFFPNWAQEILRLTPFPYLIDFPMKALLNQLDTHQFLINTTISIIWMIMFRFLALSIWKRGQYAYTGVGI